MREKLTATTPIKINKKIIARLNTIEKNAFFSTLLIGCLTHIFMFVNILPNWDSMYNFDKNAVWLSMGRWFLGPAMEISSSFDIPWIIGMWSLIFLGCTTVILVNILEIKSNFNAIIIGGLLVTFPAVTSTFSYLFLADAYMLGLMLASVAILITKKYRRGYWIGGVF